MVTKKQVEVITKSEDNLTTGDDLENLRGSQT